MVLIKPPKRFLIIRLDRIGDVVLSTPVLDALRAQYPDVHLAMMVRPICRELLEGHPALNEVLVYEKEGRHRGILATIRFAWGLRRHRFDTSIALHPSHRSHWIPWLAGIPVRIGYDRKSGWLLTHRLPHRKQEGRRHEAEYTLELLEPLGIRGITPQPRLAVDAAKQARVDQLLAEGNASDDRLLIALHPSASDASKRWPADRFVALADRLIESHRARIVLVAGEGHESFAAQVMGAMRHPALNLAGRLSVGELACLFRRCHLLVSNDSGPVHIAAAVGTPVVSIFGRNQPGINATRWRPLGPHHAVLEKPGNPRFSYIEEWTVAEVCDTAKSVLDQSATPPRMT